MGADDYSEDGSRLYRCKSAEAESLRQNVEKVSKRVSSGAASKNRTKGAGERSYPAEECNDRCLINERALCAELGIAPATARNWRCAGKGPKWIRISARCVRYDRRDIEVWLEGRRVRSTSEELDGDV